VDAAPRGGNGVVSDEDRLVACFSHVFPTLDHTQIRAADMKRLGTWDSHALLRLLARIEREFKITFDSNHINRLTSFDAVLDVVRTITVSRNPSRTSAA
jgi:acyl carrier protein